MRNWPWFVLSILIICLDQITKLTASLDLIPYHPKAVLPMVNLTLAYNSGAAFSFLSGTGEWHRWFFAGFSTLMSVGLVLWIIKLDKTTHLLLLALSLILGGAVGNLIDRACFGYVIDFIDVYYKHYHWPVFNIADSAICLGAFLLFIDMLKKDKKDKKDSILT